MTEKLCFISQSDRYVDDHHYDCVRGAISKETVPLCRRCHTTYHTWGVSSFSPDTTAKAIEVENKRREILRSLPAGDPHYRNLPPLKIEDVKRSRYWYKKHGLTPPKPAPKSKERSFSLPSNPVLCGEDWLDQHQRDYSMADIEALSIEVSYDGGHFSPIPVAAKKGTVKELMEGLKSD